VELHNIPPKIIVSAGSQSEYGNWEEIPQDSNLLVHISHVDQSAWKD
jgi:hypothetical protein